MLSQKVRKYISNYLNIRLRIGNFNVKVIVVVLLIAHNF